MAASTDNQSLKAIIDALGKIGPSAVPSITGFLNYQEAGSLFSPTLPLEGPEPIRQAAIEALRKADPKAKAAVSFLIKSLRDKEEFTRSFAAEALGVIGPDAASSVPLLIELLGSTRTEAARDGRVGLG